MTRPSPATILFVEQYYYPEGWGGAELPRDITMHLQASGHRVEVICGSDPYSPVEGDPGPDPAAAGIRIRRIPRLLPGDLKRHKLLRQLWFYAALVPLLLLRRPPDLFIAQTNPPLAVVLMAAAAAAWRRPLVIIAQDIYPELMTAHGLMRPGSIAERVLSALFGWAYRRAAAVVALGPVMRRRLAAKGVAPSRIVEISNWATGPLEAAPVDNPLRAGWGLDGAFVLLYSGNLGIGHEFDTLLDGLHIAAAECPSLRLVVVGKGGRLDEVRRGVEERGLSARVVFKGFVASEQLPASLGLADLALVTIRPGFEGLIVPSKLFGYMGRGIPTLYIGPDSDIAAFVRETGAGHVVATGDAAGLARLLVDACRGEAGLATCGDRARAAYRDRFAREHGLAAYRRLVDACLDRAR